MRGSSKSWEEWQAVYASHNVTLEAIPHPFSYTYFTPGYFFSTQRSYEAYLWLLSREAQFDVVHFPEWSGAGYWTTVAKKQGLCCASMTLVVQTHSPSIWALEGNDALTDDPSFFDTDFLERKSVEFADVVISPSQYMLDWMVDRGWRLPARSFYHPNAVFESHTTKLEPRTVQDSCISPMQVELVFFGRLERRKGLFLFLDAVSRLVTSDSVKQLQVTLLGTMVDATERPLTAALNMLSATAAASHANVTVTTLSRYSSEEAAEFLLSRPCAAAIIPSISENLPFTVMECLSLGIPLLASHVGGNVELLHPDDVSMATFAPTVDALHKKLQELFVGGLHQARALASALPCSLTHLAGPAKPQRGHD